MVLETGIKIETATAIILNLEGREVMRIRVRGAWLGSSKLNFVPTVAGKAVISKALEMDFIKIEKLGWAIRYDRATDEEVMTDMG